MTDAVGQLGGSLPTVLNNCYVAIQNASSAYCQAITRDPNTGIITNVNVGNVNLGKLQVKGIDFEGQYGFDLGFGYLSKNDSIHISTDWTDAIASTVTPDQTRPNIKNPCVGSFGTTCGEPTPKWKGTTRVTWTSGPVDFSLRWRHISSVTIDKVLIPARTGGVVPALNTLSAPVLPAFNYLDVSLAWDITPKVQLSGGVNNVLDKMPPGRRQLGYVRKHFPGNVRSSGPDALPRSLGEVPVSEEKRVRQSLPNPSLRLTPAELKVQYARIAPLFFCA